MNLFRKLRLVGGLAVLVLPLAVFAQHSSGGTPIAKPAGAVLIADVNLSSVVATTKDGVLAGSFTAVSSFGSQEGVVYGFVARSKKTGVILDTEKEAGTLSLAENIPVQKSFSYKLPTYLPEAATVYLTLFTPKGVTLAVYKVSDIAKGTAAASCQSKNDSITCTSPAAAVLALSATAGSPQGGSALSQTVALVANQTHEVKLSELTKTLAPGLYVITATILRNDTILAKVVQEYTKDGAIASIMSVSAANKVLNNNKEVTVTVFSLIYGFATSTTFTLSATAPGCGDSSVVAVKSTVTTLTFASNCDTGPLSVVLLQNGKAIDSMSSTFSLPAKEKTTGSSRPPLTNVLLFLVVGVLFVWVLVRLLTKRTGAAVVVLLVLGGGGFAGASQAHAATYAIQGASDMYFATDAATYTDLVATATLGGTVTTPDYVFPNTTYSVTVTQYVNTPVHDATVDSFNGFYCYDYTDMSDGPGCDSLDVSTLIIQNWSGTGNGGYTTYFNSPSNPPVYVNYTYTGGQAQGGASPHMSSNTSTFVSANSGPGDTILVHQSLSAPWYTGPALYESPRKHQVENDPEALIVAVPMATSYCYVHRLIDYESQDDYLGIGESAIATNVGTYPNPSKFSPWVCTSYGTAVCNPNPVPLNATTIVHCDGASTPTVNVHF